MNLFDKDKELILKLTNAVLLIWFIGALIFTFNSALQLIMKEPTKTKDYSEYKGTCYKNLNETEEEHEKYCKAQFKDYEFEEQNKSFYKRRSLYLSIANVVIVGSTLYFLNKEKESKKKK